MEQQIKPFTGFLPGNHLIVGEAGSGKTRLIWNILQTRDFFQNESFNFVLTDSEKLIWSTPSKNPIAIVNPYDPDISWIANPQEPGVYYCACDYAPRVITFLECLSTWAIQKQLTCPVRVFVDFPEKFWTINEFVDQLTRLYYISQTVGGDYPIEIWTVLGTYKDISPKVKSILRNSNLLIVNPLPEKWLQSFSDWLNVDPSYLINLIEEKEGQKKEGFYYVPSAEIRVFMSSKPVNCNTK